MHRGGRASKEVVDKRVRLTKQDRRDHQTKPVTGNKWMQIKNLLKYMPASKRHVFVKLLKSAFRQTSTKKRQSISNSKEILNDKRTIKKVVPVKSSFKSHQRYLERSKTVSEKKKTSAEKILKVKHHQSASFVNSRKNEQGFTNFVRQRFASIQTPSAKLSKHSSKGNKKTSKERTDNGVNLEAKSRIKLRHNPQQTPNRSWRPYLKIQQNLRQHQAQFQTQKSYTPTDGLGEMHPALKMRGRGRQTSLKQLSIVAPSSGIETYNVPSIKDKNTSKENKSGEKLVWVNP
jgi:hypothetical protein